MLRTILDVFKTTFYNPLTEFIHDSRAIGVVLILCTAVSLFSANISESYIAFWNTEIPLFHQVHLPHSIVHFINDGFMAVFFLLAGLEIRRELKEGELKSIKQAVLPIAGAIGGMLTPALIFLAFNFGTSYLRGWAIPTATDIAFSLGIASLLGKRVPISIKVFLTALAIIDDLGAIIVIALFYGGALNIYFLIGSLVCAALIWLYGRKIKKINALIWVLGLVMWYCMFNSGIHATIAGVLLAFVLPPVRLNDLQLRLHHPVYFLIMPLFALANTAIVFPSNAVQELNSTLSWGIMLGLFLGKPFGIFLLSFAAIKMKVATAPAASNLKQLAGAGVLAGIGFTMSIFIATLAFTDADQDISKIAILIASLASGISGYFWLSVSSAKAATKT